MQKTLKSKKQPGFSLAELLVTILVIGILAAIGFAAFSNTHSKVSDTTEVATAKSIVERFNAAQGAGAKINLNPGSTTEEIIETLSKGAKRNGLGVEAGKIDPSAAKWIEYKNGMLLVRDNPRP